MAHVKVTVNGRTVDQWIDEEESSKIRSFYFSELKRMGRMKKQPIISAKPIINHSTVERDGRNVRFIVREEN